MRGAPLMFQEGGEEWSEKRQGSRSVQVQGEAAQESLESCPPTFTKHLSHAGRGGYAQAWNGGTRVIFRRRVRTAPAGLVDPGPHCVTWASLVPGQDSPFVTHIWNLLDDNSPGFLVNGICLHSSGSTHRGGGVGLLPLPKNQVPWLGWGRGGSPYFLPSLQTLKRRGVGLDGPELEPDEGPDGPGEKLRRLAGDGGDPALPRPRLYVSDFPHHDDGALPHLLGPNGQD